jgi:hypothetical protein
MAIEICSYCELDTAGNHKLYCPMNTVNTGLQSEYFPCYPQTLNEGLEFMGDMHNDETADTEYLNGFRMGLRIGISVLMDIKRNKTT